MKRALLSILTLIAVAATALGQQPQDALYIYRNDGEFNAFFFADIDHIEYSRVDTAGVECDEYVVQEVYALDSVFRIPISAIDSVGFVTPQTKYKNDVAANDDSELWDYVIGSDTATYFILDPAIPSYLVPHVGDKLVATRSREFLPSGCYGRVTKVSQMGPLKVEYETLDFTELFDEWVCKVAAESSDGSEPTKGRLRGVDESSVVVNIPLPSLEFKKDLTIGYGFNDNWSLQGTGTLEITELRNLRVRAFMMVRTTLGLNFDLVQRLEIDHRFKLDIKGSVQGQFDFPFVKTYFLIPDTPFAVETQGGISFSATGEAELGMERRKVTSLVSAVQYNNNFFDYDPTGDAGWVHGSVNDVYSMAENTFKGTATLMAGPYCGVWFSVLKKELTKVGMRFDAGFKFEASVDLQATDLLFYALPTTMPAYMLLNPTGLYNTLNRDGSVKIAPFCTGKIEASIGPWKTEKTVFDYNVDLWKFEGGTVPKFSDLDVIFDEETGVPYASAWISRRTLWKQPVGFAAYYAKSGNKLGVRWYGHPYNGDPEDPYFASGDVSMTLPKFGGGKAVRVYPVVKLQPFGYEMLASPYREYTRPAEAKATPEDITLSAKAQHSFFTMTDNLDRNEETVERKVHIEYIRDEDEPEEEWISRGYWDGDDYHFHATENKTDSERMAIISVTTQNEDKSTTIHTAVLLKQSASDEEVIIEDPTIDPKELEFKAEGGEEYVTVTKGSYNNIGTSVSRGGLGWVTATISGGRVKISVTKNTSANARECEVECYFYNEDPKEKFSLYLTVKQDANTDEPEPDEEITIRPWVHLTGVNSSVDLLVTGDVDSVLIDKKKMIRLERPDLTEAIETRASDVFIITKHEKTLFSPTSFTIASNTEMYGFWFSEVIPVTLYKYGIPMLTKYIHFVQDGNGKFGDLDGLLYSPGADFATQVTPTTVTFTASVLDEWESERYDYTLKYVKKITETEDDITLELVVQTLSEEVSYNYGDPMTRSRTYSNIPAGLGGHVYITDGKNYLTHFRSYYYTYHHIVNPDGTQEDRAILNWTGTPRDEDEESVNFVYINPSILRAKYQPVIPDDEGDEGDESDEGDGGE